MVVGWWDASCQGFTLLNSYVVTAVGGGVGQLGAGSHLNSCFYILT